MDDIITKNNIVKEMIVQDHDVLIDDICYIYKIITCIEKKSLSDYI